MKHFLNRFNKKDVKTKIIYIIFLLTFIQLIINIFNLIKNNFSVLIIIICTIIVINFIKKN